MKWNFDRRLGVCALVVSVLGIACPIIFPILFEAVDVRFKVHDPIPVLTQTRATPHLRFTVEAAEAALTNLMTVTNVVFRKVDVWNKGRKPAKDGFIRLISYPPSILVVKGETDDKFGKEEFERVATNIVQFRFQRMIKGSEKWYRNIVIVGPNRDLIVKVEGDDWVGRESK